jgi:glucan phosphoethanolaminetransferase (alkaline phosphatase superfamily)
MSILVLRIAIASVPVCILLLLEFSFFDDFFYPLRILWQEQEYPTLIVSLIFFVWSLLGAFLIFFSGRSRARTATLPIFLFFFLFNVGSVTTSNAPIDFHQSVTIVNNFQWWFWEVVENYGIAVLPLLMILIPTIVLVERLPKYAKLGFSKLAYIVPVSAVVLTSVGLQYSQGLFDRYPSYFRVPSMFIFASQSRLSYDDRSAIAYSGHLNSRIEKIILVVDESIRADILGVNTEKRDTTPFLRSVKQGRVNFGLAASSSNCSDYANLILRTGVRKEQIPDIPQGTLSNPSVWQYARKAGYQTVYLDAQSAEEWKNYQNFMNEQEASFIDRLIRVRQTTPYESDIVALEELVSHLKSPGRTFIMLNKYGIHFPYFRSYPKNYEIFRPALEPHEPMEDRQRSMNSYMNGIRWSVDHWFERLLSESSSFRPFVIIYTSDHGQNVVDDGTLATHCRPAAVRFEGMVPMIVLSNDAETLTKLEAVQIDNFDKTSHFQIFPTLLELAGYKVSWVRERYGESLAEHPRTSPEFFVGDIYGRGSVRRWYSIYTSTGEFDHNAPDSAN